MATKTATKAQLEAQLAEMQAELEAAKAAKPAKATKPRKAAKPDNWNSEEYALEQGFEPVEIGGMAYSARDVMNLTHFVYLREKDASPLHELLATSANAFVLEEIGEPMSAKQAQVLLTIHAQTVASDARTTQGTRRRKIATTRKIGESTEANAARLLAEFAEEE